MEAMIEMVMEITIILVAQTLDGLRCPMDQADVNNRPGRLLLQFLTLEIPTLALDLLQEAPIAYHLLQRRQGCHLRRLLAIEMKTLTLS